MKKSIFPFFIFLLTIFSGVWANPLCDNPIDKPENPTEISPEDQAAVITLVRTFYKWESTQRMGNAIPEKYWKKSAILIGVDWKEYEKEMNKLRATGFFSERFFKSHREFAKKMDNSIKKAHIKNRNRAEGMLNWDSSANDWCGCQESPPQFWEMIQFDNMTYDGSILQFNWSWDWDGWEHSYKMKAEKEDGTWKIADFEWLEKPNW